MSDQGAGMGPAIDSEMVEILESFIAETREIFEKFGQDLITLEQGATDPDLLNAIFRAVHTVKGTSSFLGLEQMTQLAHSVEDVLNKLRRGELQASSVKMDVLFDAYDCMKELLAQIESRNIRHVDLDPILSRLQAISQGGSALALQAPPGAVQEPPPPKVDGVAAATRPAGSPEAVPVQPTGQPAGGLSITGAHPPDTGARMSVGTTIRVDVLRLDSLMNLVGELVLGRNRLMQIAHQLSQEDEGTPSSRALTETSSQIDFITTELQMSVMKTRMVPIAKVFNKLPRLVRDLRKETGKDLELILAGEETELDRSIIEELNDPLVHLLRNAGDHGIESPADRRAAGKPEQGTITVRAEHEGNHIVISVGDDGRGMDPEKLKAKAIEKGTLTEAHANEMSRADAFNLIFAPGFSTAARVTNVSGRGVGMDVVRTNISKLKGTIEIESEHGKGSKVIVKVPLTLAIIQALLVEVANEVFSIPIETVLEVVRIEPKDITTVGGREVFRLRNSVLPLARLDRVMGMSANGSRQGEWIYIVVVGLAQRRLGIVVDSMLGQKEVVIKSLGGYLGTIPGIAGSTILGDGRVIMILDVGEMMKLFADCQ